MLKASHINLSKYENLQLYLEIISMEILYYN